MKRSDQERRRRDDGVEAVDLVVELAAGDQMRGSVRRSGHDDAVGFCGWIDFMAVVSALRSRREAPRRP